MPYAQAIFRSELDYGSYRHDQQLLQPEYKENQN